MQSTFNAIVARSDDAGYRVALEQLSRSELPDNEVLVKIDYSTLNYKDALAVTGASPICRRLPMVCGIDLAGIVVESKSSAWQSGDRVLVNGFGLSETEWGGYTQFQSVSSNYLVKIPEAFSAEQAMAIGTAGYTAMLCVHALQDHGLTPSHGPIVVTGASGGVGSVAISLLSTFGFEVVAVSGRESTHDYLRSLGASRILDRADLDAKAKPLEKEQWAGAVDSVGSRTLATLLARTNREGIVAACGLAGGVDLPSTVMPFILRGVTLRGIDSVMASLERRQRAWDDLARYLNMEQLQTVYKVEPMSDIPKLASDLLAGNLVGRIVVDVNR
ncbi:MDR family oxidoreductase [Arenicella xantha]|uniref:Acrylyl-CoA reductase (NADPH) n=1 Tax=Arenicella xantha TaxID=644221 RepID=A0A395JRJ5_9GAMM|nr:MDR family oxidoreductase [Arenicella xantha]RBP51320.1 acrylyl-CoA reductase (NADPH) [Arenicella xantha]